MAVDLWMAVIAMALISLGAGLATAWFAYSNLGQRQMAGLAVATLSMVMFLFYGSGQLFWARIVPSSAAIIYTNLAPIFAALAAGWAWRLPDTPRWRRRLLTVLLTGAAAIALLWPFLSILIRPPPQGSDRWVDGVAMQTSWATCSPAAAATLLRSEGIEVSEAEMIPLCLTDSSGTPTLGAYRGIKLKADEAYREVEVLGESLTVMLEKNDWPVYLAVELPFGTQDRRYQEQWGWIPGAGHSVVALSRAADGRVLVGDPSVGLEYWTVADLQVLWHGGGMRIR